MNEDYPIHRCLLKGVFQGEWFNGKTAAFKVADLGSNPCSPAIGTTKVNPVNENEGTRVV